VPFGGVILLLDIFGVMYPNNPQNLTPLWGIPAKTKTIDTSGMVGDIKEIATER
jgi:hypothetical protein